MKLTPEMQAPADRIVFRAYIYNPDTKLTITVFPPKSYGKTNNFRTLRDAEKRLEIETNKILRKLPSVVNPRQVRLQGRIYTVTNGKVDDDFYALALN